MAAKRSPVVLNAARTLATKAASPSLASSPILKAAASAASSERFLSLPSAVPLLSSLGSPRLSPRGAAKARSPRSVPLDAERARRKRISRNDPLKPSARLTPFLSRAARSYATEVKGATGKVKTVIGAVVDVREPARWPRPNVARARVLAPRPDRAASSRSPLTFAVLRRAGPVRLG